MLATPSRGEHISNPPEALYPRFHTRLDRATHRTDKRTRNRPEPVIGLEVGMERDHELAALVRLGADDRELIVLQSEIGLHETAHIH